jgi:hypothetical protein
MKKIVIVVVLLLAVGGAAFGALGGVAWLDSLGLRGQQRALESRLVGYWEARVDGDLDQLAKYFHPLQPAIPDPGLLITEDYQVNEIAIEGDRATAKLTVHSRLKHPILSTRDRTVELDSVWVRYEGQWYLDARPVGFHELIQNYQGEWKSPTEQAVQ